MNNLYKILAVAIISVVFAVTANAQTSTGNTDNSTENTATKSNNYDSQVFKKNIDTYNTTFRIQENTKSINDNIKTYRNDYSVDIFKTGNFRISIDPINCYSPSINIKFGFKLF
jgi:hypothetical protein